MAVGFTQDSLCLSGTGQAAPRACSWGSIRQAMDPNPDVQTQGSVFLKVIVLLNAVIPVLCVIGILSGGILILCRNKWGYYLAGVSLVVIVARMFIFS